MNQTNDRYPCEFEPPDVLYCIFERRNSSTKWFEQEVTKNRALAMRWLEENRRLHPRRVFALVKRDITHTEIA